MNTFHHKQALAFGALLFVLSLHAAYAQDDDNKPQATAQCEFGDLTVAAPVPWYSVSIDSAEPGIGGCQLMWEEGDQYLGIIRLIAFERSVFDDSEMAWEDYVISFEAFIMEQMNIQLGGPLWHKDSLPVTGEGFYNAKAIALEARLLGIEHANEAHFLLFEGEEFRYVISALTPAEDVSPDVYKANTNAMGTLMRTLQPNR